jgi:hypothetical protein
MNCCLSDITIVLNWNIYGLVNNFRDAYITVVGVFHINVECAINHTYNKFEV